jgi:acyl-coenzyme A thioesterase PaaI-like protein
VPGMNTRKLGSDFLETDQNFAKAEVPVDSSSRNLRILSAGAALAA